MIENAFKTRFSDVGIIPIQTIFLVRKLSQKIENLTSKFFEFSFDFNL